MDNWLHLPIRYLTAGTRYILSFVRRSMNFSVHSKTERFQYNQERISLTPLSSLSTTEDVLTSHGIERALSKKKTYERSTSALDLSIKYSYFSLRSPPDGGRHATK